MTAHTFHRQAASMGTERAACSCGWTSTATNRPEHLHRAERAHRRAMDRETPDWRNMPPATFDREAKPQPLALFAAPDPTGTPDLFAEEQNAMTETTPEPEHADYPHEPGTLYDCPACESRCYCGNDRRDRWCLYCTAEPTR